MDEAKCKQIGFARCPFDSQRFEVKDGRKVSLDNSAFGTVFGVADGKPMPVCDYAGFAPFGFGYRRCPGEQLTIQVFEDFLRKVWSDKMTFQSPNLPNPRPKPIEPNASSRTTSRSPGRPDPWRLSPVCARARRGAVCGRPPTSARESELQTIYDGRIAAAHGLALPVTSSCQTGNARGR